MQPEVRCLPIQRALHGDVVCAADSMRGGVVVSVHRDDAVEAKARREDLGLSVQ